MLLTVVGEPQSAHGRIFGGTHAKRRIVLMLRVGDAYGRESGRVLSVGHVLSYSSLSRKSITGICVSVE